MYSLISLLLLPVAVDNHKDCLGALVVTLGVKIWEFQCGLVNVVARCKAILWNQSLSVLGSLKLFPYILLG